MKKRIIGLFGLVLLAGAGCVAGGGTGTRPPAEEQPTTQPAPTLPPVRASSSIVADARVVPAKQAALSMPTGGIVAAVPLEEGDDVAAGQVLLQVGAARQRAAVAQAEANLAAAEAQLIKARTGPDAETTAAAEAALEVAQAGVESAQAGVASARANDALARAGASVEEIAIAEREVERAKNALWAAQSQRDSICGRSDAGAALASECDSAQAAVQSAEEGVRIAALGLEQVKRGPRQEELAVSSAQVQEALGQLATAQAQVQRAEAELARTRQGPTAEDIAIAEAQVAQAQSGLEQARVALDETALKAPFAGTVAALEAKIGEQVSPGAPVARLADLSSWQIETEDLTERGVVNVQAGDRVTLTFDALPDLEVSGTVQRIRPIGVNVDGDITYTVIVRPDQQDARLRWNMTAVATIQPADPE